LSTYRKIEKSGDSRLKGVLHKLETSKHQHYIEGSDIIDSNVTPYGIPDTADKDGAIGS